MSSPARRTRPTREFRAASGFFFHSSTGWVHACGELVRLLWLLRLALRLRLCLGFCSDLRIPFGLGLGLGRLTFRFLDLVGRDLLFDRCFGDGTLLFGSRLRSRSLRGLGLLDRLQLLLRWQLAALGHDEHAGLHVHVGEELDRNLVAPNPLERLVHPDLPAVDPNLELVPDRIGELRLNEVSPQSLQGLEMALAQLGAADRARISVVPGTAGAARDAARDANVVIADPPRKGLDPDLTAWLIEHPPECFIYVSCGLDSFLSDTAQLTASGKLRLSALTAFNLMPFTEHVETVARFERT